MRNIFYRTKGGKVGFLKGTLKMYDEQYFELEDGTYREEKEFVEEIEKTSPFPIDLVKTGDYVNGGQVIVANTNYNYIMVALPDYEELQTITNDEIESIVTKEQFELSKFYVRYE